MASETREQVVTQDADYDRVYTLTQRCLLTDDVTTTSQAIGNADSPYTIDETTHTLWVDCSGGAVTVNLPDPASVAGKEYRIKKTETSATNITVQASVGNVEGGATLAFGSGARSARTLKSDGSGWWVVCN